MEPQQREIDLARVLEELNPLPEGVQVPMFRFSRAKQPPAVPLPSGRAGRKQNEALAQAPEVPLQWIDQELGIRVKVKFEADPADTQGVASLAVWIDVEGDDPGLAGKSASVALVNEKGDRFIDRLVPFQRGADNRCTGELRVGTVDEVRDRLASDRVTLDVFLME